MLIREANDGSDRVFASFLAINGSLSTCELKTLVRSMRLESMISPCSPTASEASATGPAPKSRTTTSDENQTRAVKRRNGAWSDAFV